jgi:hypothetical protein
VITPFLEQANQVGKVDPDVEESAQTLKKTSQIFRIIIKTEKVKENLYSKEISQDDVATEASQCHEMLPEAQTASKNERETDSPIVDTIVETEKVKENSYSKGISQDNVATEASQCHEMFPFPMLLETEKVKSNVRSGKTSQDDVATEQSSYSNSGTAPPDCLKTKAQEDREERAAAAIRRRHEKVVPQLLEHKTKWQMLKAQQPFSQELLNNEKNPEDVPKKVTESLDSVPSIRLRTKQLVFFVYEKKSAKSCWRFCGAGSSRP